MEKCKKTLNLLLVTNYNFDEEQCLVNVETNDILCKGDYYHDKIEEYIDGFLNGLDYAGVDYTVTKTTTEDKEELASLCEFY